MGLYNFSVNTDQLTEADFAVLHTNRSEAQQRHTPIAIHDVESADIKLARQLANEMINVSGAELKLFLRTDNADYDSVWDEDADPTYWNALFLKGFFKPEPLQAELQEWGVDAPNRTEVTFSYERIINEIGARMIRPGDVMQLPYNSSVLKPKNYRVLNASPTGNYRYVWLYITCQVETLTADIAVRAEDDIPPVDNINTGGVYRESL